MDFRTITENLEQIDGRIEELTEHARREAEMDEALAKFNGLETEGRDGGTGATWLLGLAEYRELRAEQRAVGTTGTFIPGGYANTCFDLLRKRTAVLDAAPVLLPVSGAGSVKVPEVTSSVTIAGKVEAAALDAGDPGLDVITLDPQKFGAYTLINREAIEDSAPQLREVVANSLIRDTAVELDKQLITGAGTGQNRTGLRNASEAATGASPAPRVRR